MEKKSWKTTAIIFIILFLIETIIVTVLFSIGNDVMDKELECSTNICYDEKWVSYIYDYETEVCYCYDVEGKQNSRYMGG